MAALDLNAYWTPNRQFKATPRMVVSAEGITYRTADGSEVLGSTSGM